MTTTRGAAVIRRAAALTALLTALAMTGCAAGSPAPTPTAPSPERSTVTPTPTPTPTPDDPIAGMTLAERVGQVFMLGTSVSQADPITLEAVSQRQVGGLFLHGRSSAGVDQTRAFVQTFLDAHEASAPSSDAPKLWVATDQEGGDVQVLSGPGFDSIPTALTQANRDAATLAADAQRWGEQLIAAGVNMNLAPVADIVTGRDSPNPPIGQLNREYGFDEAAVAAKAGAFAAGMRAAGVMPTLKHFPGLGRVTQNTDYSAGVVDTTVTAQSPDVGVYRTLLAEGPAVVMMSTAVYELIDPGTPAAFSPTVVGVVRNEVGFEGVVTTDDLSAADQVASFSPGDRATLAIGAGVDLVLVSADPSVFPEMYRAVLDKAQSDPAFAERVDAAARRVIAAKATVP